MPIEKSSNPDRLESARKSIEARRTAMRQKLDNRLAQLSADQGQPVRRADLARALQIPAQYISNWEARDSIPKKWIFDVAGYLEVTPEWLSDKNEVKFAGDSKLTANATVIKRKGTTSSKQFPYADEDYIAIKDLDVKISAGKGNTVTGAPDKTTPLFFRTDWLQQQGWQAKQLRGMTADGDSMSPTISHGATLLVNKAETTVDDGKIYIIRYGNHFQVKRLFLRPDGGITIHSDNRNYPERQVTTSDMRHVSIIGRVVWQAGTL